jgi:hypothetical protein
MHGVADEAPGKKWPWVRRVGDGGTGWPQPAAGGTPKTGISAIGGAPGILVLRRLCRHKWGLDVP